MNFHLNLNQSQNVKILGQSLFFYSKNIVENIKGKQVEFLVLSIIFMGLDREVENSFL